MGESGSGKTTIADLLEQKYGLTQVRSYTTRSPRTPDECSHTFVTVEEFNQLDDFVAYTFFDGNYYGATAQQIDTHNVFVVDPYGVQYFKEHYHGNKIPIVIYLSVPSKERFNRMLERGDSVLKSTMRLQHDSKVFSNALDIADYVIENNHVYTSVQAILNIVSQFMTFL